MAPATEATRRLGIRYPIIQGPFGGGLSSPRLAAAVSELGGMGSYGAHNLAPDQIGTVVAEIRGLTRQPFNMNLWVSDHDPGGLELDAVAFEQAWRIYEPYFRELGVAKPERPRRVQVPFAEQMEALLAAAPP